MSALAGPRTRRVSFRFSMILWYGGEREEESATSLWVAKLLLHGAAGRDGRHRGSCPGCQSYIKLASSS